jgi:hypothetical protein
VIDLVGDLEVECGRCRMGLQQVLEADARLVADRRAQRRREIGRRQLVQGEELHERRVGDGERELDVVAGVVPAAGQVDSAAVLRPADGAAVGQMAGRVDERGGVAGALHAEEAEVERDQRGERIGGDGGGLGGREQRIAAVAHLDRVASDRGQRGEVDRILMAEVAVAPAIGGDRDVGQGRSPARLHDDARHGAGTDQIAVRLHQGDLLVRREIADLADGDVDGGQVLGRESGRRREDGEPPEDERAELLRFPPNQADWRANTVGLPVRLYHAGARPGSEFPRRQCLS